MMEKQLKDYLHLYLGCEVIKEGRRMKLTPVLLQTNYLGLCKPILRPLIDMTEEEAFYIWKEAMGTVYVFNNKTMILNSVHTITAISPMLVYLISKHFDLFGLIEAGLAIDKTTLTK